MPFIEDFKEFTVRMGCTYEQIENRYLFANGGQSTGELGQHVDPPSDKWESLYLRREFLRFKLDREVRRWHEFQQACLAQASAYRQAKGQVPPPPHDADEQLERGRERIDALQGQVDSIDEQLNDSPQAEAARERDAKAAEANAYIDDLTSRIRDASL